MSGLEPFEVPLPDPRLIEARDRALRRIGWALLAFNGEKYCMAERHLAEAMEALQELQRMEEGNGKDR